MHPAIFLLAFGLLALVPPSPRAMAATMVDLAGATQPRGPLQAHGYHRAVLDGIASSQPSRAFGSIPSDRGQGGDALMMNEGGQVILADATAGVPLRVTADGNIWPPASLGRHGLPEWNGATVLMHRSTDMIRRYVSRDRAFYEATARAEVRLAQLYQLRENPALLDHPDLTSAYLSFIPREQAERFATPGHPQWHWIGDNQFEIEDNRQAFLAAHRQEIMAQTNDLPDEIIELRSIAFGEYDMARGRLRVTIQPWGAWGVPHVTATLPYSQPTGWTMDADMAREVFNEAAKGYMRAIEHGWQTSRHAGILVMRQKILGGRPDGWGALLELAAMELSVYDVTLQTKIADMPLPEDAITLAPPGDMARDAVPEFDAIYAKLWSVAAEPGLLDDSGFLTEAYRIRRQQEKANAAFSFPAVIGAAMRQSDLPPSTADLQTMREWLRTHSENLSTRVVVSNLVLRPVMGRSQDRPAADLISDISWRGGFAPGYGGQGRNWIRPAEAAAKSALPNSAAFFVLWSGDRTPALVALHPHLAWAGVDLPFRPEAEPASLELEIRSARILSAADGTSFVLFDAMPTALRYAYRGQEHHMELTAPEASNELAASEISNELAASASSNATRGQYDIADVYLGTPLAEAEATVRAFLGVEVERQEWPRRHFAPLADAIALLGASASRGARRETVVLYFDKTLPERPVIAIGRSIPLDRTKPQQEIRSAVFPQLESKFGQNIFDDQYGFTYWSRNTIAITELSPRSGNSKSPCSHFHFQNFPSNPVVSSGGRFGFPMSDIKDCGEVASVYISNEFVNQFVTDTSLFLPKLAREAASQPPPAPAQPIRF